MSILSSELKPHAPSSSFEKEIKKISASISKETKFTNRSDKVSTDSFARTLSTSLLSLFKKNKDIRCNAGNAIFNNRF